MRRGCYRGAHITSDVPSARVLLHRSHLPSAPAGVPSVTLSQTTKMPKDIPFAIFHEHDGENKNAQLALTAPPAECASDPKIFGFFSLILKGYLGRLQSLEETFSKMENLIESKDAAPLDVELTFGKYMNEIECARADVHLLEEQQKKIDATQSGHAVTLGGLIGKVTAQSNLTISLRNCLNANAFKLRDTSDSVEELNQIVKGVQQIVKGHEDKLKHISTTVSPELKANVDQFFAEMDANCDEWDAGASPPRAQSDLTFDQAAVILKRADELDALTAEALRTLSLISRT